MRKNLPHSPGAARRNRTSSLSRSAILVSPDQTSWLRSSSISRREVEKFPFEGTALGSRPESPCFHNGLDGRKGPRVSGRVFERCRNLEGGDVVSSEDGRRAAASHRSLQRRIIFSRA